MIDFLKQHKAKIAIAVGILDILAGYLSFESGDSTRGILFVSLGIMFIIDGLE